jgi:hypothetical protein
MAFSMTSGNIKYVFTQALAPSGEGEVEGSLWYNTTLNRLETYNGSTWVNIGTQRVQTGTYTGDGSTSQGITGVGFQPTMVMIRIQCNGTLNEDPWIKHEDDTTTYSSQNTSPKWAAVDNCIISLDADGFTIDDAGSDQHPNKNGVVYVYIAFDG